MISRSIIRPYPTGACAPAEEWPKAAALVLPYEAQTARLDKEPLQNLVEARRQRYADWPVHIQGQRQTCIAFAAAACIELLRAGNGQGFIPLSPQFLYWYMRTLGASETPPPPGWEGGATKLGHAMQVLVDEGVCPWSACPYMDRLAPAETDGLSREEALEAREEALKGLEPNKDAITAALKNRIAPKGDSGSFYRDFPDPKQREPGVARMVYDQLRADRPVAIALPVFYSKADPLETNWDNPVTTSSGVVVDPIDEDWMPRDPDGPGQSPAGHAVCTVGFQPDDTEPNGGWFIFRNSRGINWAGHADADSQEPPIVPARGYGAISATYVEQYCWEMLSPRLLA